MTWHPLFIAIIGMDALCALLLLSAAWKALHIILEWSPQFSSRKQIVLETQAETASIQTRWGLILLSLSSMVLIIGITNVLPAIVPGAMCGTGVMQATQGLGNRAITLRFFAITMLYIWTVMEKLNQEHPMAPLTVLNSRVLLLALTVVVIALNDTFKAVWSLDTHQPVNCCAMVYDQFRSLEAVRSTAGISNMCWVGMFIIGGFLTIGAGVGVWRLRSTLWSRLTGALAGIAIIWVPVAAITLVRILSAYHYEVLHHHCPWCLFLPEHRWIGFPLLAALTLVILEGLAAVVTAKVAEAFPNLKMQAVQRSRHAGFKVALGGILFMVLSGFPSILWRLRYGVWMS